MSKNEKTDCPDGINDQEDIQWFENYEKHSKTKHLERLKNEDILNYIKDVYCRLEVNSGDEDYASTKKSSSCSVKCSGTQFKSFKKIKSRITLKKSKNIVLKRKPKQSFCHNVTDTCNYCCSARKFHFRDSPDFIVQKNSRKKLNTSTTYIYQPKTRYSYKYHKASPTFYGWYSKKNHKMWPAVTEIDSHEIIKDRYQNTTSDCNFRINKSKLTDKKSTKVRTFKSLHRKKFGDSTHMDICSNVTPNEKTTEKDSHYCARKQREEMQMRKLNEESDVDFVNQQPLNKIYSSRDAAFSYQTPMQNGDYKGCYTSGYHYPVRRSRQPTSLVLRSQSNRLTTSAGLSETSSLLQRQTSQWENEMGPPLKATSSIIGTSIDRSYQETRRKNNTDSRRQRLNVLRERELCYRRPGLLRESGKLVHTREDSQWLECCCENAERDETVDCSRHCRCSENTNDPIRLQRESTHRPFTMSRRANYTVATRRGTPPELVQLEDNDEGESESTLSMVEDPKNEEAACNNHVFDDDVRTNDYDDLAEDLKTCVSFLNERTWRRGSNKVSRQCKKMSDDLKNNQGEAMEARTLGRKIIARYPAGKEFSYATRTPRKSMPSGDSSGLRYDAAGSTCECKEPFHDPPAACLTGSCTCIENDENAERNDDDSPGKIFDTVYDCCCCCSCSSSTSHEEKDPVKKLESFCEKVKAVNQDMFHKLSKSTCRDAARINAQEYAHGDSYKQNQSASGVQRAVRRTRPVQRERLVNPVRLRLEKPKHSHSANLEKILVYPPQGENGPPLTLYKRSSNISCRVKGDADTGFRYNVTYVQKFISPTWMPSLSPGDLSREADEKCGCAADHG